MEVTSPRRVTEYLVVPIARVCYASLCMRCRHFPMGRQVLLMLVFTLAACAEGASGTIATQQDVVLPRDASDARSEIRTDTFSDLDQPDVVDVPTILTDSGSDVLVDASHLAREFWVSPSGNDDADGRSATNAFRTFERAQIAWRLLHLVGTGDVIVHVCGARHERNQTLELTSEDSPNVGWLRMEACAGDTPILSAAHAVSDFTLVPGSTTVYQATVPTTARPWLWSDTNANPVRVQRSRSPNYDPWDGSNLPRTATWLAPTSPYQLRAPVTFTYRGTTHAPFDIMDGITAAPRFAMELVASVRWVRNRVPILAYARSGDTLFVSPEARVGRVEALRTSSRAGAYAYTFERPFVIEGDAPDTTGEYTFERARPVVHVASSGAPPMGLLVANGLSTLIRIHGATRVRLQGLGFAHTTAAPAVGAPIPGVLPASGVSEIDVSDGTITYAPHFGSTTTPAAALVLTRASQIEVLGSRFVDMGGVALAIDDVARDVRDVRVEHTLFRNIGRNAILTWGEATQLVVHDDVFEDIGIPVAGDAIGLLTSGTFEVSRCTFSRIGGRAIYAFGQPFASPIACCVDGIAGCASASRAILRNRITSATLGATDLGAINLGVSNVRVQGNVILHTYPSAFARSGLAIDNAEGLNKAIYLDIGTRGACVTGNVASGGSYFVLANCQAESTVRDNYTGALGDAAALVTREPLFTWAGCDVLGPDEDNFILPRRPTNWATCTLNTTCSVDPGTVLSNNQTGADPVAVAATAGASWTP
jgi:hypothetical protein